MILPLFSQLIISGFGWRAAYASLGALALLLGLPLTWRYVRERTHVSRESASIVASGLSWQQGLRSFAFWIIVAVLFVGSISTNGAITHMVALLTDRHISAKDAALCASLLGGSSLLGRVGVGWLLDRFFGSRVAFLVSLLAASGLFLLARANSLSAGFLAAILIGIGVGGEAAITPYLLTRYFGLRGFAVLYGLTWTFYAAAGAIGPIILGRSFDLTGSYTSLLVSLSIAMAVTAATLLFLPRYPVHAVIPSSTLSQGS
jgi:predicted MFS family arabinose efflux permease